MLHRHPLRPILCALFATFLAIEGFASMPGISAHIPYAHPKSYFESRVDLSEPERFRIQKHLAQVEAELRAHPPGGLSPEQTEAREQRLNDLHAYWMRGEFPRNLDFQDSLVPYFIDARGVACAVGHLVIASGHGEFAESIRRTRNHAYIREIEDSRLSEWAEASGLTLEECARIQPGYGGPVTYPFIRELEVGPEGAVWIQAGQQCLCSMNFMTFSLHSGGSWVSSSPNYWNHTMLCQDPQGRRLIGVQGQGVTGGLLWEERIVNGSENANAQDCAWSPDGFTAFVVGEAGLRPYRKSGSALLPMPARAPIESMMVVAASRNFVWSGSNRGAFGGQAGGAGALTRLDSAGESPFRVTGLSADGMDGVWAGINGNHGKTFAGQSFDSRYGPVFSRRGLLMLKGITGEWTAYTRAKSGLPSDTIQAIAATDSQFVWIATSGGIYRFTPPGSALQVLPSFDAPITALATDSLGRLYIGTWGSGVYRWHAGTTQVLGYYTTSSSLFRAGRRAEPEDILLRKAPKSDGLLGFRSLLGRRTDAGPGPGIYVLP